VSHCSSEFKKKVSSKDKNAGKKHWLSRLKGTFLFVYDPIVLFCFQNSREELGCSCVCDLCVHMLPGF